MGGQRNWVNAFWATQKFLCNSPGPRNITAAILEHLFQQGQHKQVSLNLISSMMLFISLNQAGIHLMSVQDRFCLSLSAVGKAIKVLSSWAVNRKDKKFLADELFYWQASNQHKGGSREPAEKTR